LLGVRRTSYPHN
ncbi:hypothetical protein D021_1016B, partial [Vibrio parahaemolyticus 10296]